MKVRARADASRSGWSGVIDKHRAISVPGHFSDIIQVSVMADGKRYRSVVS
jgi:hypothetical protein